MLDLLFAVLLAILIAVAALAVLWLVVVLAGAAAGIELLNVILARLGFSRPSPEGRTPGQRHTGEVTTAFRYNAERGCAEGTVRLHGEIWNADCPPAWAEVLRPGTRVTVVYGDDLRVRVDAPPGG
jgi:membrane protein implicated in regulation of membrane protease activity